MSDIFSVVFFCLFYFVFPLSLLHLHALLLGVFFLLSCCIRLIGAQKLLEFHSSLLTLKELFWFEFWEARRCFSFAAHSWTAASSHNTWTYNFCFFPVSLLVNFTTSARLTFFPSYTGKKWFPSATLWCFLWLVPSLHLFWFWYKLFWFWYQLYQLFVNSSDFLACCFLQLSFRVLIILRFV